MSQRRIVERQRIRFLERVAVYLRVCEETVASTKYILRKKLTPGPLISDAIGRLARGFPYCRGELT